MWSAEAPGGLPKAVKFVYGYHEEKRAQAELKALNRIREVRHPFLLSLERIDVVDGQLIVITELADMCLKTRFEECVESGLKGIPRAELLNYMREAASALDFISEEFKLQHLDVKPENVLLVSGHIKVSDFGLVKDIHDGTQSMMSGLTPAYAPPELFDGRPSKASDQYSLAILFQEMLTGLRSFDGTTAAQLATQHIKERPNLRPLPREDQAVIARALSKNPESRYPNCTTMVEELCAEAKRSATPRPRQRTKLRDGKRRRSRKPGTTSTLSLTGGTRQFEIRPKETEKLPRIDYDPATAKCRPTLYIGLGGTGTEVLRQIRRRLNERHGGLHSLPSIKLLAIDTDVESLSNARGKAADRLTEAETFPLQLREPKGYRDDASMHLSWLNRRWIYNVPKSLRTEGIRPLGRLAMATHIDDLSIRIRQVMSELHEAENLATTAETLELDPDTTPRVVIVGAISGGTCSGSAIDFAYLVRDILGQLGAPTEDVLGVFTHSTSSGESGKELAIANTLAFLSELYHFSCVEEYPGDESLGIPPSTDRTTTFASTYLVELGDDLPDHVFDEKVDGLAEYLYLAGASKCGTFFDNCRRAEKDIEDGLPLRTFGISQSSQGKQKLVGESALWLGGQLVEQWTQEQRRNQFSAQEAEKVATAILEAQKATLESIVDHVHQTMADQLGDAVSFIANSLLERFNPKEREESKKAIQEFVRTTFDVEHTVIKGPNKLFQAISEICDRFREETNPKIAESMMYLLDSPGIRLAGVNRVAAAVKRKLATRRQKLEEHARTVAGLIEQRYEILESPKSLRRQNVEAFFQEWAKVLLQRFTIASSLRVNRAIEPAVSIVSQATQNMNSVLLELTQGCRADESCFDTEANKYGNSVELEFHRRIGVLLRSELTRDRKSVDQQVQESLLDRFGGLRNVLGFPDLGPDFREKFRAVTRAIVVERLKTLSLDRVYDKSMSPDDVAKSIGDRTKVPLLDCGGGIRAACAYPLNGEEPISLIQALGPQLDCDPTSIRATVGQLVTCIEAERVPLENVAMYLLKNHPDSIEYASRLHTRMDIDWTHISSMH